MRSAEFTLDAGEAVDVFENVENRVMEELAGFDALQEEKAPRVPKDIRSSSSRMVGEVLVNLTQWWEDVIQPRVAHAHMIMQVQKKRMAVMEGALRKEAVRIDAALKKSGSSSLLTAEVKSDLRHIAVQEDLLVAEAIYDRLEGRSRSWRRQIDTVSRIITQQTDEIRAGQIQGRVDRITRPSSGQRYPPTSHLRQNKS